MPMTPAEKEALEALEECIRVCSDPEWNISAGLLIPWAEWARKARLRAEAGHPEPERLWSLIHATEKLLAGCWNAKGQESRDILLPIWRVCERLHIPGKPHFYNRIAPAPPSLR